MTAGRLAALGALALWLAAVGCAARPSPPEVVIGATLPLSGSEAAVGAAFLRGCERAVAERNAAGGLRLSQGSALPVRLAVRDTGTQTPEAERLVGELAEAGVAAILATPDDVRAVAQAVAAERAQWPLVVHPSNAPGVPEAHMRWVFALPPLAAPVPDASVAPHDAAAMEARGYETVSYLLAALESAERLDALSVRAALQSAR